MFKAAQIYDTGRSLQNNAGVMLDVDATLLIVDRKMKMKEECFAGSYDHHKIMR